MNKFEDLPNEILLDVFQYFDARDLFQLFYQLNTRLNNLLKSSQQLNLIFHMQIFADNQINDLHLFPHFTHTLIVGRAILIDLNQFRNIRSLKLECPLKRVLSQLTSQNLPYLEHLSVSHLDTLTTADEWTSLPSLRTLRISRITLVVYHAILKACQHLHSLELAMFSCDDSTLNIESHSRLKRLVMDVGDMKWPWTDHVFDSYLSCAPNIEHLIVYRSMFSSKLTDSLLEYDWLASKLFVYLAFLQQFKFYFKIIQGQIYNESNVLSQLEEKFLNFHCHKYQSRLIIYE
ncbi:unnamed protein product [Adineta ricciae]|uniref:F-box domain-containing protein n=1 Tax=Adineta ricciae TaxID=249248 RepID=A0A814ATH9_ADIRI|nr:unnamed protein product [Adineta ricciae]CAF1255344.1 unnamed protein product [Adineta ricciae]